MCNKKHFRFALLLFLSSPCLLRAQNTKDINLITTATPFLRVSPDANAGGMGDAAIASSIDANAVFWNLGKLPFALEKAGLAFSYAPWLRKWTNDMYLASIAGYYKFESNEVISGSIRYFNLGDVQFKDNDGNYLQSFHPREFAVSFGYSRKMEKLGVGIGIKYINSDLANKSVNGDQYTTGTAVAADLGFYYNAKNNIGKGWAFGASITNLGSKIGYQVNGQKDYLPANFGLGMSYAMIFDDDNNLSFDLDMNKLLVPSPPPIGNSSALAEYRNKSVVRSWFSSFTDAPGGFREELKEIQISIGGEYLFKKMFAFRAGYFYENKLKGNRNFFCVGTGIKYNNTGVNFSWLIPTGDELDQNPLSNTLRFSLLFEFK
jgi:hypothetical protein